MAFPDCLVPFIPHDWVPAGTYGDTNTYADGVYMIQEACWRCHTARSLVVDKNGRFLPPAILDDWSDLTKEQP